MNHPLNHPNLIVVTFDQYAGGKFFINCVSHNLGVLPGLSIVSNHDQDSWVLAPNLPNIIKNEKKIERINSTLPSKSDMQDWSRYELDYDYFWGATSQDLIAGQEPNNDSVELLQKNICFLVNHDTSLDTYNKIKQQWPRARHVALINVFSFQKISAQDKNPNVTALGLSLPDNLLNVFYVDVDRIYPLPERVRQRAVECVEWIGVQSAMHPNLKDYVENYLKLHY